jgi:ferrochelatase
LRQFLSDPRVLDMPGPLRWLLLNLIILPFRPRRSAEAYSLIWTDAGSPLIVHGRALVEALRQRLSMPVELAMRYGEPSISGALQTLTEQGAQRIVVVVLYPHYASATTGSTLEEIYAWAAAQTAVPALSVIDPYYDDALYIQAMAHVAGPLLEDFGADHVLFSYHGLPERQIQKADASGDHCLASPDCCAAIGRANRNCYKAHCHATSRALAAALVLPDDWHTTSFQSRLGRVPWIRPYTDEVLEELARQGVRRLAVLTPSFTADCLETLEEIGMRGKEIFKAAGGEEFLLVPCLNAEPVWADALASWISQGHRVAGALEAQSGSERNT